MEDKQSKINVKSILEMNGGAFMERADYEVAKILNNIFDPNTKPTQKRTMTLKIDFIPDDDRTGIQVEVTAASKLANTTPSRTSLYVAGENGTGEVTVVEMLPQLPGQTSLDGMEQTGPATLKVIKCS